jgi:hypothetical protein
MNSLQKLIAIEDIFLDIVIGKHMLKKSYTLNLGQLIKISHELKIYLW